VNWRDIRATIQREKPFQAWETSDDDTEEEGESNITTQADPVQDPLKWMDSGLPEISGFENRFFDLATQFEISRYIDVLADSVSDKQKTTDNEDTHRRSYKNAQKNVKAVSFVPDASEWEMWD
jgi:hypothetical protein